VPWERALRESAEGTRYDGLLGAYYSDERAAVYLLSDSLLTLSIDLIARKDSGIRYETLKDLRNYKIGIIRGSVNSKEFDAATYLNKDLVSDPLLNLRKLLAGRVDLIVDSKDRRPL